MTNITTAEGILLRMNRSIQVEAAFGVMKEEIHKFDNYYWIFYKIIRKEDVSFND